MSDPKYKYKKFQKDDSQIFKTLEAEGKMPPQNIELEESILGSLMMNKNVIIKIADILLPDDFYRYENKVIYETIIELFQDNKPIDIMTVTNRLKEKTLLNDVGGASTLASILNKVPATYNCEEYAQIIHRKRILRDLIAASYEIGRLGLNENDDIDMVLNEAEQIIFQIAKRKVDKNFVDIKSGLTDAFERIDMLQKNKGKLRGITTGFVDLDNLLGGLQKSDMVVLGARPSVGKTSFVLDIARKSGLAGSKVAIFSLEMSSEQLVDRLIASEANVNLYNIRNGRLSTQGEDNDFALLHDAFSRLSEAAIFIDDTPGLTALQIRTRARRLMAETGLDLIIIDYLQLIGVSSSYSNPVQQYSEISKTMKIIARELNVPVLVLSQLSRSVEQRTPPIPKLSDLRETGCLAGDSLIMRSDTGELVPIKTLVNSKQKIQVHSLNHDWSLVSKPISKAFSSGKKMTYELKLKSGSTIKASNNHPFWKVSGWTRLDELSKGDFVATPRKLKVSHPKNELTKDEIILLAHLLGDGCILPKQPYHYTSADPKNIEIVAKTAKKLFKIKPNIVKQKNWWHVYLSSPQHLTHNVCNPITKWFETLNIERAHSYDKKIPSKVFTLDDKNIALFLKHLWATDGNISLKTTSKNHKEPAIYYSSTSYDLAWGVKHLLLRLGIRSKLTQTKKGNYRPCYNVTIYGSKEHLKFLQLIGCYGKRGEIVKDLIEQVKKTVANPNIDLWPCETWKLIIEPIMQSKNIDWKEFKTLLNTRKSKDALFKVGISEAMIKKIAQILKSPVIDNMINSDIIWDEVVSIKKLKVEEVFDVTVPGLHNFVANDIILENSIEQDADVVMLIYREDRWKKTPENENIATIDIAKHRNGPTGQIKLYFEDRCATFRNLEKTHYSPDAFSDETVDYKSFVLENEPLKEYTSEEEDSEDENDF